VIVSPVWLFLSAPGKSKKEKQVILVDFRKVDRMGDQKISAGDPLSSYYIQFQSETYLINYIKIGTGPTPIFAFPGIMGKSSSLLLFLQT